MSARLDGHTSSVVGRYPLCRSRHSGPAPGRQQRRIDVRLDPRQGRQQPRKRCRTCCLRASKNFRTLQCLIGGSIPPHAIAVYAWRPLSPVATQHSLQAGRYPLLGPDFHQPDCTSLRLAHSLDHLVGERQQRCRNVEVSVLAAFKIDRKFEVRGCCCTGRSAASSPLKM